MKILGEQLTKDGVCRGVAIRDVPHVSALSEFQTKEQMLKLLKQVLVLV